MKASDVFPSNYLRAADLDGREPIVTIARVGVETFGDESKPVVFFQGKEKGVVLNKTNFNAIVDITREDDTDNWPGHQIKLITVKVEFQGKRVPAIRVEDPKPTRAIGPPRSARPVAVNQTHEPAPEINDDDIPF